MRKRRRRVRRLFLLLAVAICIAAALAYVYIVPAAKEEIVSTAAEQLIKGSLPEGQDAEEILETMSEDDRETVEEICSSYITPETLSEIAPYITQGDTESIIEYAEENVSEEDIEELIRIYREYVDEYGY